MTDRSCSVCGGPIPPGDEGRVSGMCQKCLNCTHCGSPIALLRASWIHLRDGKVQCPPLFAEPGGRRA